MLVLFRRPGESIVLSDAEQGAWVSPEGEVSHPGSTIEVSILSIHGGQVRIGVSSPQSVAILRSELVDSP